MSYVLRFSSKAAEDIEDLKRSGNKAALKKLYALLKELREHLQTGTGQPDLLKYDLAGCWSRRINKEHYILHSLPDRRKYADGVRCLCKRAL